MRAKMADDMYARNGIPRARQPCSHGLDFDREEQIAGNERHIRKEADAKCIFEVDWCSHKNFYNYYLSPLFINIL